MSRRSTAVATGLHHYTLECDHCWTRINAFAASWAEVEAQALRAGWSFDIAHDRCPRCRP